MSYFFENWPTVSYDVKKNNKPTELINITLRFKIAELLRTRSAVIYEYNVPDGMRPDAAAYNYYGDATLDWLLILVNTYIDPLFEWPMDDRTFETFIRKKYGSSSTAMQQVHHYEIKLRDSSVTFDGIFVPEKSLTVDKSTYDGYDPTMRTTVDNYTYELRLNEKRKIVKVVDKRFASELVSTYERLIRDLNL